MKKIAVLSSMFLLVAVAMGQSAETAIQKSPAELAIQRAQKSIAANSKNVGGYHDLALGFGCRHFADLCVDVGGIPLAEGSQQDPQRSLHVRPRRVGGDGVLSQPPGLKLRSLHRLLRSQRLI